MRNIKRIYITRMAQLVLAILLLIAGIYTIYQFTTSVTMNDSFYDQKLPMKSMNDDHR